MSNGQLDEIKCVIAVKGQQAKRHSFIVSKVRRLLWPFLRSYLFLVVDWVGSMVGRSEERTQAFEAHLRHLIQVEADRVRAAQAEALAASRHALALDEQIASLGQRLLLAEQAAAARDEICRSLFGPLIMKKGDHISNFVATNGIWDAHLLPWIQAGAKRGRVAVDAGAHFGTLASVMAEYFHQVHAFEANHDNFRYLCANAQLRQPGRIIAHNYGLYSSEINLSLAEPVDQEIPIDDSVGLEQGFREVTNTGALTFSTTGSGVNTVRAMPLDSFNLQNVGFIKIDCQGSDGAVIMGALETIRRCRPIVVFEWEDHLSAPHGVSLDTVRAAFGKLGYIIDVVRVHNKKQIDYVAKPNGE